MILKVINFLILILLLSSCSQEDLELGYKSISFTTNDIEITTRSSITSTNTTDIWIMEGDEVLVHQYKTDENFGTINLSLSYGTHNLTFLSTRSENPTMYQGVFSCTKVLDTYSKSMTISINKSSPSNYSISLSRCMYGIVISAEDTYPNDIEDLEVIITNHCLSYKSYGVNPTTYSRVFDLSSLKGKTPSSNYTLYGFLPEGTNAVDVTLNFRRANEEIIVSRSITDVPVEINKKTTIQGFFFNKTPKAAMSIEESWGSGNVIDYNNM